MNGIIIRRNCLFNNICSFNSPYFQFKETLFVNFFTDPELSSSLYLKNLKFSCIQTYKLYKILLHRIMLAY